MITIEPYFDMIVRRNADWVLVLRERMTPVERPVLIYDGRRAALLRRNMVEGLVLTEMPTSVRNHLKTAKQISVAEVGDDGNIINRYTTSISVKPEYYKKLRDVKKG